MLKNITALQWLGIIILFNTTLLGSASQLGDLSLSPSMVKFVLALATIGNGFLGGLVTMFGGQSSMTATVSNFKGVEPIKLNSEAPASLASLITDPGNNVSAKPSDKEILNAKAADQ